MAGIGASHAGPVGGEALDLPAGGLEEAVDPGQRHDHVRLRLEPARRDAGALDEGLRGTDIETPPNSSDWRLRATTGVGSVTYVDSAVDETDTTGRPPQTAVNTSGEVVFGGNPSDPLLFVDGDVLNRVVCRDQLAKFGSIGFSDYAITPRASNNLGEIAFRGGTGFVVPGTGVAEAFVVRAVPEPGSALQGLVALMALRLVRRRIVPPQTSTAA